MSAPPENRSGPSWGAGAADEAHTQTQDNLGRDVKNDILEPGDLLGGLVPRERRIYEVKRAALFAILRIEDRNFTQIAKDLHVERATVSAAYTKILSALGMESIFRTASARITYAKTARAGWQKRKGAAT